jgi:hypothetical protein
LAGHFALDTDGTALDLDLIQRCWCDVELPKE